MGRSPESGVWAVSDQAVGVGRAGAGPRPQNRASKALQGGGQYLLCQPVPNQPHQDSQGGVATDRPLASG